ncbi:MAG: cation:proton antiporter [Coraliomargarita sp.]
MTGFAILLIAAALAFGLARLMRIPPIPLLMLSGIGLQALFTYIGAEIPRDLIYEMTEVGLAVLVFTAGVDLSPQRLTGRLRPVLILGTVQFLVLGIAGLVTALWLDYSLTTAVYLGCALSASSTLVVVRHLQQRRQLFEPYGRLVLGVLLIQDVLIILLLVALSKAPDGAWKVVESVGETGALGLLAVAAHRWFVPWVTRSLKLDEEELMLGALAMLFAFSGMAWLLDLPFLVGAFFAGFALSAFPMNGLVRGMLTSLSGFFLALFFIAIGCAMVLPDWSILQHSLIFIVVLIVVTVILVTVIAESVGYSTRVAIEAGILLSQTSEFSLLLAFIGVKSGQISPQLFSMIALITVSTMTLTPFISRAPIAWWLMNLHPRYRKGEAKTRQLMNHAVLIGYGRAGPTALRSLKSAGIETTVVDDDAAIIRQLAAQGVHCIQGDGAATHILAQANAREARIVLCSMRRTSDVKQALSYLKDSRATVIVRTFEPNETVNVRAGGGIAVETAPAATEALVEWMEANELLESRL